MTYVRLIVALLWLALASLPMTAFAACTLSGNKEIISATISSPITIDPNAAIGTVLATSPVTNPSPSSSQVTCNGNNTTIGVINLVGAQPAGSSTIFPTNIPGVGYSILHPDSTYALPPYGSDSIGSGTFTLSVASAIQLIKTGPITAGSTLSAGTLGFWQYAGRNGTLRVEDFVLANAVKFVAPTCTVTTPSISVTLPTVSSTSLSTPAATAGATAFNIGLNCVSAASGQTMAIQFDTAKTAPGTVGVITPGGTAKNVGVQLVDSSFNAVTFGTPAVVGTTPSGTYNLTYYARYYATATPVGAGTVSATATFTISYP
jgi:type 1 fimbria pilin